MPCPAGAGRSKKQGLMGKREGKGAHDEAQPFVSHEEEKWRLRRLWGGWTRTVTS